MSELVEKLKYLLEGTRVTLSNIKPSAWCEKNRMLTTDVSPKPGPYRYDYSPYLREIVDCLSPDHPARIIAVMKGAQVGFSTGVIEAGIGYIMAENPGNILFLTGHQDLTEEAIKLRIDQMIQSSGIQHLIRPNVAKKNNLRTGDTTTTKEFPGGSLVSGSASNHKMLRQRSVRFGFIDDFESAKGSTEQSGSTTLMIEQRFAAYGDKMKLFYISTPEIKKTSNIEPVYLQGDQRKYKVPCPCCGEMIELLWTTPVSGKEKRNAGITYETDKDGKLVEGSVGYTCQLCLEFFTEKHKFDMISKGRWVATAKQSEPGYYSYHLSALYAPPGMFNWTDYVRKYIKAHPLEQEPNEKDIKAFTNLCLGLPYEEKGDAPKANDLQKYNIRPYEVGTLPEKLSIKDGNGRIVLLTCACDLNGILEDARLDYEIVAWTESEASYSIDQGSIGTFVPKENSHKIKQDRERWTYEHGRPNSVWKKLNELLSRKYITDTGRSMSVFITGVDTGHYTLQAYSYLDHYAANNLTVGLKGKDADKYIRLGMDTPKFKKAKERLGLYLVEVGVVKDDLAATMKLKWDPTQDSQQPARYMNFPQHAVKYQFKDYFEHYQSEHKVTDKKDGPMAASMWVKKGATPNHFWDVRCYNIVVKDIFIHLVGEEVKAKITWSDYVSQLPKIKND